MHRCNWRPKTMIQLIQRRHGAPVCVHQPRDLTLNNGDGLDSVDHSLAEVPQLLASTLDPLPMPALVPVPRLLPHLCIWAHAVVVSLLCLMAHRAAASCNLLPGVTNTFRGARGTLDRPFAGPGDLVELRLIPVCDTASPGFDPDPAAQVVTLVFTPPNGARNLVVLATDCAALESER